MLQKVCLALALATAAAAGDCKASTLDFVMLEGEASHAAIEEDIRKELAVVGIEVVPRVLNKEDFNTAMIDGDFELVFSETWGAPYDPHSYVKAWTSTNDGEGHPAVLASFPEDSPLHPDKFEASVASVLAETDEAARQDKWTTILSDVHEAVIHLPLWGKRIPSVTVRNRLEGYQPGHQQFDYPIQRARVVSGPKTVKVAPGATLTVLGPETTRVRWMG